MLAVLHTSVVVIDSNTHKACDDFKLNCMHKARRLLIQLTLTEVDVNSGKLLQLTDRGLGNDYDNDTDKC